MQLEIYRTVSFIFFVLGCVQIYTQLEIIRILRRKPKWKISWHSVAINLLISGVAVLASAWFNAIVRP